MFKLIYRNLIAHRRRYLWIMLELCIAVFVSWDLLDKVIVNEYNRLSPLGYDIDRLVSFQFRELPPEAMPSDYEKRDIDSQMADVMRIIGMIREDSRVEAATIASLYTFEKMGIWMNTIPNVTTDSAGKKSKTSVNAFYINFWRGTDFFKTFGLKDASGTGQADFAEQAMTKSQIIVSKSIAEFLFPKENAIGHSLFEKNGKEHKDGREMIVGVVNNAIYRSSCGRTPIVYKPQNNKDVERSGGIDILNGVIRLKEGVDMNAFIRDMKPKIEQDYRFGEIYCESLAPYNDLRERMARDVNNDNFIAKSIALFFFINILLCMTGTFYLQTRQRSEESGVMRSFGASHGFIIREMLGEGFIMVTLAWLCGCGLYWLVIHDSGLADIRFMDYDITIVKQLIPLWYDDFWTHFTIVSLIIYAIMLIAVMLGIWFPARRISRIKPIDALRDE
ncbi:MAG: FtsX-like permease family protein [Duncaniella sp.]|uniref:ABC transporter permease n=1 Tax=Duncaniella sp. TaxID=2518496 RepID=UPI0023CC3D74|nr:FtsX-like permease family protein [Duncaniella sp.]MDE5989702.1 FtsX-like permease family protein [Duncaniella sp.]